MMTLKHVLNNGDESVFEVEDSVHFASPADAKTSDYKVVYAQTPKGQHFTVDGGTVYVMNSFGKTIARYTMLTFPATIQFTVAENI